MIDQYGYYNYTWLDAVNGYNLQLFNEKGTECYLNRDELKETLTFMQNLNKLNRGYTVTAGDFDMGKVVFAPMPFSQYRAYKPYPWSIKKYSTFEWDCVRMPVAKGKSMSAKYRRCSWRYRQNPVTAKRHGIFENAYI